MSFFLNLLNVSYSRRVCVQGYGGNVTFFVTYKLMREQNELSCSMKAVTDEATPSTRASHNIQ